MNGGGAGRTVRPIGTDESVTEAVVLAVSEATGRPPTPADAGSMTVLAELFGAVDPDAVDALFRDRSGGSVAFVWSACQIEIVLDGGPRIVVTPLD